MVLFFLVLNIFCKQIMKIVTTLLNKLTLLDIIAMAPWQLVWNVWLLWNIVGPISVSAT